ncbi:MAG: hypothetical protein WC809_03505 [Sinimarinibacterium sp.]|jgi:hypothetical protein
MLRSFRLFFVALFLLPLAALAQDNVSKGTISEMGFGKFVLKESGGLARVYLVGKRDTSYEPDDWRPADGDQVQVAWFEKKGKLVASNVKLVRLGPNSVNPNDMVSPMRVKVQESGRSGIIAKIKGTSKETRFAYARKRTEFEPVGWQPQAGEEVEVQFEAESGRSGVTYVLTKITRIK